MRKSESMYPVNMVFRGFEGRYDPDMSSSPAGFNLVRFDMYSDRTTALTPCLFSVGKRTAPW